MTRDVEQFSVTFSLGVCFTVSAVHCNSGRICWRWHSQIRSRGFESDFWWQTCLLISVRVVVSVSSPLDEVKNQDPVCCRCAHVGNIFKHLSEIFFLEKHYHWQMKIQRKKSGVYMLVFY